jgi:hypothetical protein
VGTPLAVDNIIIVAAPNSCVYNGLLNVTQITVTSGVLNLNGFVLTATGSCFFNGGTVSNGTINPTGTTGTFAGTIFNAVVNANCGNINLNGSVFNNVASFTKTGATANSGSGGNTFNATTTFNQSGTALLRTGNVSADVFNADLYINCTNTGNVYLAENGGTTQFNGNIIFTSNSGSDIYFCNGTGTASLAIGKSLQIGGGGFSGNSSIRFKNFIQTDPATAQVLTNTSGNGTAFYFLTGNSFAGNFTATAGSILFHGSTFSGNTLFVKYGTNTDDCNGGNNFLGSSNVFSTTPAADRWRMANVTPDVFNNSTFIHEGASNFIVARQTLNNIFNGTTTFSSNTTGGVYINRANASNNGSAIFNGPVLVYVTLTGNVTFAEGSATYNNACTFNSSIQLNSSANSTGDIIFGSANNNNSNTLNPGAGFIAGSINGQTNVYLRNVTQTGATSQVLNTSGSTGILYVGGVTTLTSPYPCSFAGNCTFSADTAGYISSGTFGGALTFNVSNGNGYLQSSTVSGNLNMTAASARTRNNIFNGTSNVTHTGAGNSTSNGGNTFNGNATISCSGAGQFRNASYASDNFNANATFVQTGAGAMMPVYSNDVFFAGNISTVGSNAVVNFGSTGAFAAVTMGSGLQTIDGPAAFIPVFTNLTTNHTGTVQLNKSITVSGNLNMNQGVVNLNALTLTLGTGATAGTSGLLAYTGGWLYGGTFTRWHYTTSFAVGNARGHYPMGTSQNDYRPLWLAYSSNLTTGGTMSIIHNPVYPSTYLPASHFDASWGFSVQGVSNSSWVVSTGNGFAFNGASGIIRFGGTGFNPFVLADLDASFLSSVTATHGAATSINTPLEVNRTGITTANISNTWRIGTKDIGESPLPVQMISFDAQLKDEAVQLTWQTASEKNSHDFVVERSSNGRDFETLITQNAAGNSLTLKNYSATDGNPLEGISYYRIREINNDGTFSLTDTREINFTRHAAVIVSPNPCAGSFNVKGAEGLKIEVVDALGRLILSDVVSAGNAFSIKEPCAGIYFVRVLSNNTLVSSTKLCVE